MPPAGLGDEPFVNFDPVSEEALEAMAVNNAIAIAEYLAQGTAQPSAQQQGPPQQQQQNQNQQNQQTQNNQQSTAQTQQQPAARGINPNYTFDHILGKVSDFSAGAGDCLTGRCLFLGTSLREKIRQLNGSESYVAKGSGSYLGGKITGGVVGAGIAGLAAANAAVGLESKVAIHGAHHAFEWLGGARLAHIQITLWLAGAKGSDFSLRVPLFWK